MKTNVFLENETTREMVDIVTEKRLFTKPFDKSVKLPIPVHLVSRSTDLRPFQTTQLPESQISGRTWIDLLGSSSIPAVCGKAIAASGITKSELSKQSVEIRMMIKPYLEELESEFSLEKGALDLFFSAGLRGRYFLGRRVEFLYELFLQAIFAGGFPCGWIAKFPPEMQVGFYPLESTLVVFSPI